MEEIQINNSTACIYQIRCKDVEIKDVYVGSTNNLAKRRNSHKTVCTNEKDKNHNFPVYQFIRDNGGWGNWEIIKVEDVDCTCHEDLLKAERACFQRLGATLNKNVPSRSWGERYEDNKAKILEQRKEYYEANKAKILERTKEYYESNRTKITDSRKAYYETNKSEIAEKRAKKVTCGCGSIVSKSNISQHRKTIKHQKYLESLN